MKSRRLPTLVIVCTFGLAAGIAMLAKTVRPAEGSDFVTLDLTRPADAARGAKLFGTSCAQCHGANGRGMPHQGPTLRDSKFVAHKDDHGLIAFVRTGRSPYSPDSVMGGSMPAKGGVANFTDNDLQDIVAHVRTLQKPSQFAIVR